MNKNARNIVLTGGTRGIGLSHAHYLAKQGYHLAIIDISKEACAVYGEVTNITNFKKSLDYGNNRVEFYECDLTDFEKTDLTFSSIIKDFGNINALIANAGGDIIGNDSKASGGKAENNTISISVENHNQVFNRNYITCFNSIKAIAPYLKKNRYGKIVTTSSISAGIGVEKETAYAVSKAAVMHLTRCVAAELRSYDINVNCIAPGATLTERFKTSIKSRNKEDLEKIYNESNSILNKPADPMHISAVVSFLLSKESDYISGQVIRIDGGQFTSPI